MDETHVQALTAHQQSAPAKKPGALRIAGWSAVILVSAVVVIPLLVMLFYAAVFASIPS